MSVLLRASSYEPGYRDALRLGFIGDISAQFPRREKVNDPGDEVWRQIREKKQTWRDKNFNLLAYHSSGNS